MSNAIKPRTTKVVIYDGEDLSRLAELDRAVERAQRVDKVTRAPLEQAVTLAQRKLKSAEASPEDAVRLLHQDDPLAGLRQELRLAEEERDAVPATADAAMLERDDFAAEAEVRGVSLVMIARPRKRWRDLTREHPPRDGDDGDEQFQVNMDTLPDVLLLESIDQQMSTSIDVPLEEFLDGLSNYDYYDRLFVSAFALNRGSQAADPTRRLLSASSHTSAATSS